MKPRMRVAITARSVFPLHGLGGLERSVYDLARHLAARDVEVTLITKPPAVANAAAEIGPGVTVRTVPYRTFPFAGRRGTTILDRGTAYPLFGERAGALAASLVQAGAVDIVHGFGASVLGYARRRGRLSAPLVLNPQGLEEFGATDPSRARLKRLAYLPLRRAVRVCADAADAVIATDRALEPAVRQHLHVSGDRLVTIPNALDLMQVDALASPADGAAIRAAAGIRPDERVLLSVGRLEHNKGFHVLAAALAALRTQSGRVAHGGWRWVIVGDGPHRARLERRTTALALHGARHVRGTAAGPRPARLVRSRRSVRAPDAVRGQFARHARGHGAPAGVRRHRCGRAARQGGRRCERMGRAAGRPGRARRGAQRCPRGSRGARADGHGRTRRSSSATSRGTWRWTARWHSTTACGAPGRARRRSKLRLFCEDLRDCG